MITHLTEKAFIEWKFFKENKWKCYWVDVRCMLMTTILQAIHKTSLFSVQLFFPSTHSHTKKNHFSFPFTSLSTSHTDTRKKTENPRLTRSKAINHIDHYVYWHFDGTMRSRAWSRWLTIWWICSCMLSYPSFTIGKWIVWTSQWQYFHLVWNFSLGFFWIDAIWRRSETAKLLRDCQWCPKFFCPKLKTFLP